MPPPRVPDRPGAADSRRSDRADDASAVSSVATARRRPASAPAAGRFGTAGAARRRASRATGRRVARIERAAASSPGNHDAVGEPASALTDVGSPPASARRLVRGRGGYTPIATSVEPSRARAAGRAAGPGPARDHDQRLAGRHGDRGRRGSAQPGRRAVAPRGGAAA